MHSRLRAALIAIVLAAAAAACGIRNPLAPEYEYEEDLTLSMDGSATLVVNSSVPALNALKGLSLETGLAARSDQQREKIRAYYESPQASVGRISTWTRRGRRFYGIHLTVSDVRELPRIAAFAGARFELKADGDQVIYRETLWKPPAPAANARATAWRGDEIIAFRLHLPARIRFQNSRYLDNGTSRPASRGNILTWEQRLSQRLEGRPLAYAEDTSPDVLEARMDRESILYRTLWLFGIAFGAALLTLAALIWLTVRRGRDDQQPSSASH